MEYLSPADLRFLATRATIRSSPGNSLVGINTTKVMNGAYIYIEENNTYYFLDKTSTIAPLTIAETIVAPDAGPGRWFAVSGPGSTASFTGMTQMDGDSGVTLDITTEDQWKSVVSGNFTYINAVSGGIGGTLFTFSSPSPALVYHGPDRLYKIWAIASVGVGSGAPATFEFMEIAGDLNGTLVGTDVNPDWAQRGAISDSLDIAILTSVRIQLLTAGDSVNIAFRNISSSLDLDIAYFTLMLEPVL